MHSFQVKPVSRLALANHSPIDGGAAFARLMAFVARILGRRDGAKSVAVPQYEGHAWCDSLEHRVNSDMMTCRRARL